MTGPEHYRKAEELIGKAAKHGDGTDRQATTLAAAQVHATLALAAATAMPATDSPGCRATYEYSAWNHACGVQS